MWCGWASLGGVVAAWLISPSLAAAPAEWRPRSIYALLTDRFARTDGSTTAPCNTTERQYCGGTWRGIIDHLDYIQGMGFSAIYISPVTKQIPQVTGGGAAYHGYWQQDIFELNSNFGSADDLRALASALHSRDMYLMVDVVANDMAFAGPGYSVDYSAFVPFNSPMYYHPYCPITDYNNQTNTEVCWLGDNIVSLPDLDTTRADVKDIMYDWIKSLVANYSIDGLRIDAARHVQKDFWPVFNQIAGVFSMGEVFDRNASFVCSYQQVLDGVLNYPIYFALVEAFKSPTGNFSQLVDTINAVRLDCKDTTLMGTFLENHDNPRLPSYTNDSALDKNGIAFTILWDGIPMIYAGEEQHFNGNSDPSNREALWLSGHQTASELYQFIALTNRLRNFATKQDATYPIYLSSIIHFDNHTLALRKGSDGFQVITVLTNVGSSAPGTAPAPPSPPSHLVLSGTGMGVLPGEQLTDIYTCAVTTVDSSGNLSVTMEGGLPKVFYPTLKLTGSGICGQ